MLFLGSESVWGASGVVWGSLGRLWGGFGRLWEALKSESVWAEAVEALPSEGARRKKKGERRKRTKKQLYINIL